MKKAGREVWKTPMREAAVESHPFRKVREKGWGTRHTHRKERDKWGTPFGES